MAQEEEAPLRPVQGNPGGGGAAAAAGQEPEPWYSQILATVGRMFLIYTVVNLFKGAFSGNQPQNTSAGPSGTQGEGSGPVLKSSTLAKPIWAFGTPVMLKVYLSEEDEYNHKSPGTLFWESNPVQFGNWEFSESHSGKVDISKNVQNNGTLYAHILMIRDGSKIDPEDASYDPSGIVHFRQTLTRYHPQKKLIKKKRLISQNSETDEISTEPADQDSTSKLGLFGGNKGPIVSYWHNNFTINLINHEAAIETRGLPPPVLNNFHTAPVPEELEDASKFKPIYPVLFLNDFWVLQSNLNPINETTEVLPLNILFEPMSLWKFQMMAAADVQMRSQLEMMGGDTSELDLIKSTLMDTNPWLLALTMVVSLLHSLFDFLAFKNDISFWKNKKDSIGVSVRTLGMNMVFQVIIFLYLLDNSETTSWMVLLSSGVGLLIEAWKIKKALNASFVPQEGWIPFKLVIESKETTELEDKTDEYDSMAYKYLSYVAYPLLAAYAVYSVMYEEHKGWYSFLVNTAVGFVYTFGFITMTPQLFINYKLKSVAHMPWKTFMYKSLNTFVDDLFAFIIKMPTLHRLACLRDDVVFFVYLYQRWIYKEDASRPNEFGQVGEDLEKLPAETSDAAITKKNN